MGEKAIAAVATTATITIIATAIFFFAYSAAIPTIALQEIYAQQPAVDETRIAELLQNDPNQ
ncbi:MAG: hypothetical protein ACREAS_06720 [Nitrososphaera sp.]